MRGTKRLAPSDSNPMPNDSLLQSKRVTFGAVIATPSAELSQKQSAVNCPPLDKQRAESSRQHVRALNAQFASWVKSQLESHPDELWEDGLQDYLNHANTIMDKFSDVVNWLRANAAKGESTSAPGTVSAPNTFGFESTGKDNNQLFGKSGTPFTSSTPSFGASLGTGSLFDNKKPFSFGLQTSTPGSQNLFSFKHDSSQNANGGLQSSTSGSQSLVTLNHDSSHDADGEDLEQPSSPSVKKVEEKGVVVVHEVKCKLYMKSSDPTGKDSWKDKGTGHLSIKCKEGIGKGTRDSKPTIMIRNDVGKLLLNALLYPGIKTSKQKNGVVTILHTLGEMDKNDTVVAQTCLIRTKTEEDRDKLAEVIQDYAPAAS